MKLKHFVSGSALVLTGWLVLTFFHEVSPQEYPKQRVGALPAQTRREPAVKPLGTAPTTAAVLAAAAAP